MMAAMSFHTKLRYHGLTRELSRKGLFTKGLQCDMLSLKFLKGLVFFMKTKDGQYRDSPATRMRTMAPRQELNS
jgi:hypothetical protein